MEKQLYRVGIKSNTSDPYKIKTKFAHLPPAACAHTPTVAGAMCYREQFGRIVLLLARSHYILHATMVNVPHKTLLCEIAGARY